jgi:hypothetical protein
MSNFLYSVKVVQIVKNIELGGGGWGVGGGGYVLSRVASLGRKDEPGAVADPQLFQSPRLIVEHESILQIIQTIVSEILTLYRYRFVDLIFHISGTQIRAMHMLTE